MSARLFGLDIGRSFIKVVKVEKNANKKVLVAAQSIQTPPGGIQSESQVDLEKLTSAIRSCVGNAKLETNKCAVSIMESQVVTRLIQLPNLTEKELAAAINWEAEQYIPLPIKDVSLQYKVLSRPETAEMGGGKMDVLLIAAPHRVINKYLGVVKKAGLDPVTMETESIALSRALILNEDPPTIIISFGAFSTELIACTQGSVLFTRSIASGGTNLTHAIMAEFNLPQNQAEEYKQTYGILTEKLSGKVAAVLKPILEIIISEIAKAVEFVHSHNKDAQVSRIVICAGGAYLPGLSEFLAQRTNMEVSLGDAWVDFEKEGPILKLIGQGAFYCVATGLALKEKQ